LPSRIEKWGVLPPQTLVYRLGFLFWRERMKVWIAIKDDDVYGVFASLQAAGIFKEKTRLSGIYIEEHDVLDMSIPGDANG